MAIGLDISSTLIWLIWFTSKLLYQRKHTFLEKHLLYWGNLIIIQLPKNHKKFFQTLPWNSVHVLGHFLSFGWMSNWKCLQIHSVRVISWFFDYFFLNLITTGTAASACTVNFVVILTLDYDYGNHTVRWQGTLNWEQTADLVSILLYLFYVYKFTVTIDPHPTVTT